MLHVSSAFFVARSDVGPDVGFEATGVIDAKLPTIGVWARKPTETKKPIEVGTLIRIQ